MAMRWRGLPAHPDELLAKGKLLTHSVRFWGDLREPEIRGIFRAARAREKGEQNSFVPQRNGLP
jgi:hypothetical protein